MILCVGTKIFFIILPNFPPYFGQYNIFCGYSYIHYKHIVTICPYSICEYLGIIILLLLTFLLQSTATSVCICVEIHTHIKIFIQYGLQSVCYAIYPFSSPTAFFRGNTHFFSYSIAFVYLYACSYVTATQGILYCIFNSKDDLSVSKWGKLYTIFTPVPIYYDL